jgi:hypothetical protein
VERECSCGRRFTPKPGPGRPRRKCEKCSPPEARRSDAPSQSRPAKVVDFGLVSPVATPTALSGPRGVVEAAQDALEAAGRAETPLGAIALQLAKTVVEGGHTASGLAALSKELRSALEAALAGAPAAPDLVDELKERRERRRGA